MSLLLLSSARAVQTMACTVQIIFLQSCFTQKEFLCELMFFRYLSMDYITFLNVMLIDLRKLSLSFNAAPRATLTPLSWSPPNFQRARYLDIRMLTRELTVHSSD